MVLNAEKRRMLAEAASKLKASAGPSGANVAAPAVVIPAPTPSAPAPANLRQKGMVEATASEDEDICSGLVFKRKMGVDGCVPSFRENPPSASSPFTWWYMKVGGRVPLKAILARLSLLSCSPFSKKFFKPSKTEK